MRLALRLRGPAFAFAIGIALVPSIAHATFHEMQIERVVGGVNGDVTAQAIQLRMRIAGQNFVSQARIYAWDATGSNPVLVKDLAADVANGAVGSRVLIASASMAAYLNVTPNFTMSQLIPPSYLAAGKLTYEDDLGGVLWSFAWGGAAYTGDDTGDITNDADGNFGPPFASPLPTAGTTGVFFTGAAGALSTNNAANYAISGSNITLTNNAAQSANVSALGPCGVVAGSDLFVTPSGGTTFDDFSVAPIPAGFFGPGSDPFTGLIPFSGQPLAPSGPLGPTDTIVRRDATAALTGPSSSATIPIEMVALSLVSLTPITVTYNGGQNPEVWNVAACLSPSPQPIGSMHVVTSACACAEGGTFTSTLPVLPKLTFTRVGPPGQQVLDFAAAGRAAISFAVGNGHWLPTDPGANLIVLPSGNSVDGDCDGSTPPTELLKTTNFVTGGRADRCGPNSCVGVPNLRVRTTQELATAAHQALFPAPVTIGADGDADGVPDAFDNCLASANPQQTDTDDDGVGNACDNCVSIFNACQEDANANGVGDSCEVSAVLPAPASPGVELGAPSPNPARQSIDFTVSLPQAAPVRLALYDLRGRRIGAPLSTTLGAGVNRLGWRLVEGSALLRSGTYYLRLEAGGVQRTRVFQVVR